MCLYPFNLGVRICSHSFIPINCFALYDEEIYTQYFKRFLVFHLTIVNSLMLIFSSAVCFIDSSFLYVLLSLKHHSQGSI